MRMADAQWIPSTPHQTWDALHDPAVLQRCLPGCISLTRITPTEYAITLHAGAGDAEADFEGEILLSDQDPPKRFALAFEGKSAAAGMAIGTAQVSLSPKEDGTRLSYTVAAMAGGKLAEERRAALLASASELAGKFFAAFIDHMAAQPRTPPPPPPPAPAERGLANSRWSWLAVLIVLALILGYHLFK